MVILHIKKKDLTLENDRFTALKEIFQNSVLSV